MNRDEVKTILATMSAVYPQNLMPPVTELTANVWFQLLSDIDYKTASAATASWLTTNKYPPTIADIREIVFAKTLAAELGTAEEAWGKLQTAIIRHGWTEESMASDLLGERIWATVGSFGWKYWCQMPIGEDSTYFAQFRNAYNVKRKREIETAQIPEKLRQALVGIGEKQLLEV